MHTSLASGISAQYIVDNKGKKTGVILDIKLFDALLEELEDLYDVANAERIIKKRGKRYSLQEVEKILAKKK